jgi:hypothetical protein
MPDAQRAFGHDTGVNQSGIRYRLLFGDFNVRLSIAINPEDAYEACRQESPMEWNELPEPRRGIG